MVDLFVDTVRPNVLYEVCIADVLTRQDQTGLGDMQFRNFSVVKLLSQGGTPTLCSSGWTPGYAGKSPILAILG